MTVETDAIIAVVKASGLKGDVTDLNTPDVHSKTSNHYKAGTKSQPIDMDFSDGSVGLAVDFGKAGAGTLSNAELKALFELFWPMRGQLRELILNVPDVKKNILKGQEVLMENVPTKIASAHRTHLHIAVSKGMFLVPSKAALPAKGRMRAKRKEEDEVIGRVAICASVGTPARWVLTEDGGVRALGGAEFFGSILDLPAAKRPDRVLDIAPLSDRDGYMIIGEKDGKPDWFGVFDLDFKNKHMKGRRG